MIEAGAITIQLAGKRIHIRPLYDMVREGSLSGKR